LYQPRYQPAPPATTTTSPIKANKFRTGRLLIPLGFRRRKLAGVPARHKTSPLFGRGQGVGNQSGVTAGSHLALGVEGDGNVE
jgi:hypothetical protein